jgi:hypothetical protein
MTALLFTSCNSSSAKGDAASDLPDPGYSYEENGKEDTVVKDETAESRRIIKTYNMSLESKRFAEDCSFITTEAERLGGYIASSSVSGNSITSDMNASRTARYTVRVPADQADAYVALLSERCNVRSFDLKTEDITESYYGIRAQLESLVVQEQKLTAMLEKADSLAEMITLDDKLTSVRARINELNYKLQNMDKSVEYSYIYINLHEVVEYQSEEKTYWQKFGQTVVDSFENFVNVLGILLIVFVWIAPFALVVCLVIAVVVLVAAKRNKKKRRGDRNNDQP